MSTVIICALLILFTVFTIRSYMRKLAQGCCGGGDMPEKRVKVADKNTAHYPYHKRVKIKGMTCKNCVRRIENEWNREEGCYMIVDLKEASAELYMKEAYDDEQIRTMFKKIGYQAEQIETI